MALSLNCIVATDEPTFQKVKLLPNPNDGNFYLMMPGMTPDVVIVTDIAGRQVLQVVHPSEGQIYQLGDVSAGVYIVSVRVNGHSRNILCVVAE